MSRIVMMERVEGNAEEPGRVVFVDSPRRRGLLPVPRPVAGVGLAAALIVVAAVWLRPDAGTSIAFADVQGSPRYPAGLALRFARVFSCTVDELFRLED